MKYIYEEKFDIYYIEIKVKKLNNETRTVCSNRFSFIFNADNQLISYSFTKF